jgi:site-specific DNA-cytosine methylase
VRTLWFTKSRRAQNEDDYETWIEGGVMPTMNAFDNGDVRTTIIIFHPHYHDGARVQGDTMNTLTSRMGTGGNNVSMVATIPIQGTIIGRSDTAGPQGKGYGEDGDPMYTLDSVSGHGVAVVKAYDEFNDSLADTHHTLRSGTKQSTGVLITEEEDMATLMRMREGKPGGGKGPLISEDKSLTIATSNDQTLFMFEPKSAFEENWAESNVKNALRAGASKSSHAVESKGTVRRLTPVECERLQGFPDDWTAGQSDSSRYKQMGNAVAVPVVEWVIGNICDIV